jgi:hypothetical protein
MAAKKYKAGVAALQRTELCRRPHHQDHRHQPQQSVHGCDMCFALSTPLLFKACLRPEFKRMQILRLLCVVLKIKNTHEYLESYTCTERLYRNMVVAVGAG